MDLGVADRVYVVTGGARGLGRATAEVLVAEGARVVLSGRSQESLGVAVAALGSAAVGVAADNADPATPQRLLEAAQAQWGRLDGALISVGGPPRGGVSGERAITDEQWADSIASVFVGAIRLARELSAAMADNGSLAFVLSTSVRVPVGDLAISNALRPGLAGVAKTLVGELGPRGGLPPGREGVDPPGPDRRAARVRPGRRVLAVTRGVVRQRRHAAGRWRADPGHLKGSRRGEAHPRPHG
jgi:3-oxoacyl-[acyl-carrier protein] reductase